MIVNEFIWSGGAEKYAVNLYKILKKEQYNVKVLTFDNNFSENISYVQNVCYQDFNNIEINEKWKKIGKVLFQPILYLKLVSYLDEFHPNHILINNLFSCPITFYSAVNGFDNIQIVHDAGFVCPKSTCIKNNGTVCLGYKNQNCKKYCTYHNSKIQLTIKCIQLKVLEFLRKKVIRVFVSPSAWLRDYLNKYGFNAIQIENPIEILKNERSFTKNRHLLYVGVINENKGIFQFIEMLNKLQLDIQLDIIGKPKDEKAKKKLKSLITKNSKISYLGEMDNENVLKYIQNSYCLVVPSVWLENYPTTILEGISQKTLVIGNDRGGITELIKNKNLLFQLNEINSIKKVLEYIYGLSKNEYDNLVKDSFENLSINNSPEVFAEKITNLIEQENSKKFN